MFEAKILEYLALIPEYFGLNTVGVATLGRLMWFSSLEVWLCFVLVCQSYIEQFVMCDTVLGVQVSVLA